MKQSFSITTSQGQHLHLISYYSRPHANQQELMQPTQDPALKHIVPLKGMYPESTVHDQAQGPVTTRTPMQSSPYVQSPAIGHRQQAYHPYQVPAGYAWPPSPVATPPHGYPMGLYGQPQHALPPPPGSVHNSPHQYMQHGIPHQMNAPQANMFDRPPPPLQDNSIPQPPPHLQQRSMPPQQMSMPVYAPNPSPRVAQAKLIAEQQAQQAHRLTQHMPIDPRITGQQNQNAYNQGSMRGGPMQYQGQPQPQMYGHGPSHNAYSQPSPPQSNGNSHPSPQSNGHSHPSPPQSNSNSHGSPQSQGTAQPAPSPKLSGHGQQSQNGSHARSPSSTNTPPQAHSQPASQPPTPLDLTPGAPPPIKNDVSTGNSIPSISSLVNPEDSAAARDTRSSDGNSSRSGSRSPKDGNRATDIPNDKLSGFGEDARALGVLNRKLCI